MDPEVYPEPKKFNPARWDVSVAIFFDTWLYYCVVILCIIWVNGFRDTHPKQELSFPLEQETGYAQETISQRWRSPFFSTTFSLAISEFFYHLFFSKLGITYTSHINFIDSLQRIERLSWNCPKCTMNLANVPILFTCHAMVSWQQHITQPV